MERIGDSYAEVAPGVAVSNSLEATSTDPALPYDISCHVRMVHGQPICTKIEATKRPDGPAITRRGLNSIPIAEIVRATIAHHSLRTEPAGPGVTKFSPLSEAESAEILKQITPRLGRKPDAEHRREKIHTAATLYRDLVSSGIKHPKPIIAQQMHLSPSYIGSLLTQARKQGLLGEPPGHGKAGETRHE